MLTSQGANPLVTRKPRFRQALLVARPLPGDLFFLDHAPTREAAARRTCAVAGILLRRDPAAQRLGRRGVAVGAWRCLARRRIGLPRPPRRTEAGEARTGRCRLARPLTLSFRDSDSLRVSCRQKNPPLLNVGR